MDEGAFTFQIAAVETMNDLHRPYEFPHQYATFLLFLAATYTNLIKVVSNNPTTMETTTCPPTRGNMSVEITLSSSTSIMLKSCHPGIASCGDRDCFEVELYSGGEPARGRLDDVIAPEFAQLFPLLRLASSVINVSSTSAAMGLG